MKRLALVVLGLAVALPIAASADEDIMGMRKGEYGMAGCGLGSMVFAKNSTWHQVFAATTNGTGIQTFGITTGTSNCSKDSVMGSREIEKEVFVSMNFDVLNREMAQGGGETLAAYANLLGCSEQDVPAFFELTQEKYSTSLGKAETPEELLQRVDSEVNANERLSENCVG